MTLILIAIDPAIPTKTSRWDSRGLANSIVSTNARQLQPVILIAVGATSGTLEGK
jgi:hypothetical protein